MLPRVFIGTMFAGEGDLQACIDSVRMQKNVDVKHHIISNLPEKEAHNKLWQAWRDAKHEQDMFVKLDADTMLAGSVILESFWTLMSSNPRITGIQAPLADFFTDGAINGLNCFHPRVTFNDTSSDLFCDRGIDVDHDIVIKSKDVPPELRPAGYHCYNASDEQAFHFGLHRMLKGQVDVISRVRLAYRRNPERKRGLALIGASMASNFSGGEFNYTDQRFRVAFEASTKNYNELVRSA